MRSCSKPGVPRVRGSRRDFPAVVEESRWSPFSLRAFQLPVSCILPDGHVNKCQPWLTLCRRWLTPVCQPRFDKRSFSPRFGVLLVSCCIKELAKSVTGRTGSSGYLLRKIALKGRVARACARKQNQMNLSFLSQRGEAQGCDGQFQKDAFAFWFRAISLSSNACRVAFGQAHPRGWKRRSPRRHGLRTRFWFWAISLRF
jgi:hypothetical protein